MTTFQLNPFTGEFDMVGSGGEGGGEVDWSAVEAEFFSFTATSDEVGFVVSALDAIIGLSGLQVVLVSDQPATLNGDPIATTPDIDDAIAALIDSSPGTLDTLNELAAALGDDANFASTVTTALAGKSDTGHSHAGGGGGSALFGDGSDGVIDFDGTNARLGLTPSAGVYTLTRDIYLAGGSQVSGTAVIRAANFRIFCNGTFTVGASASVNVNGTSPAGTQAGGAAIPNGVYLATGAGSAGGTAAGVGGNNVTAAIGGAAGAGGASGANAGGGGGTVTAPSAQQGGVPRSAPVPTMINTATTRLTGGAGAGGGGGDGTNAGGGGGAGGGILVLSAKSIVNSGTISANGGNGATRVAGNVGGGGGGGGGAVYLVYNTFSGNAATADGGAAGNGVGTGSNGVAGSAGNVITISNA